MNISIFIKCPYCGCWVELYWDENGEYGAGFYCPACRSRISWKKEVNENDNDS